ncbi:MAG: HEPN domain-containing protein [Chloroflexi bacterium]|nr:HEPN domain-containing protein [Chloroflexota bacterium]
MKAAYWHLMAEEPKWTHQTDELAAAVAERVGIVPESIGQAISELLSVQENARHPSSRLEIPIPAKLFDEAAANLAIDQAAEVLIWVEALLQLPTGKPKRKKSC